MTLPYAPTKVRVIDDQGYLSREWHMFFDMLYQRVGGPVALTNVQLQESIGTGGGGISPYFIDDIQASDDGGVIPGPPGPSGLNGSTGPSGPAGFGVDGLDGEDGYPIPGPMGPPGPQGPAGSGSGTSTLVIFQSEDGQDGDAGMPGPPGPAGATGQTGAAGAIGPAGFGIDGSDGDDGYPIPGPVGPQGPAGSIGVQGATGPAAYLEAEFQEAEWLPIPGPAGPVGTNGANGVSGAAGPAVYMDAEYPEPDWLPIPGAQGPTGVGTTGSQGPAGPAIYLEAPEADEPMMFQGPQGNSSPAGLLSVAGGLTALTTIAATVTLTTGGITLASQVAAAGSVWRVRAMGTFVAVSSATARNATIQAFWGATGLTALTVGAVLVSTAQTTNFECEFILTSSSTTAVWTTGWAMNRVASATALVLSGVTPASVTVTAGAQTLDLRFAMSVAVAGDSWSVQQVTIERLK